MYNQIRFRETRSACGHIGQFFKQNSNLLFIQLSLTNIRLQALKAIGIRCYMVTGDNQTTALAVARVVGIDTVRSKQKILCKI